MVNLAFERRSQILFALFVLKWNASTLWTVLRTTSVSRQNVSI